MWSRRQFENEIVYKAQMNYKNYALCIIIENSVLGFVASGLYVPWVHFGLEGSALIVLGQDVWVSVFFSHGISLLSSSLLL